VVGTIPAVIIGRVLRAEIAELGTAWHHRGLAHRAVWIGEEVFLASLPADSLNGQMNPIIDRPALNQDDGGQRVRLWM